jgi:hypothetical protein
VNVVPPAVAEEADDSDDPDEAADDAADEAADDAADEAPDDAADVADDAADVADDAADVGDEAADVGDDPLLLPQAATPMITAEVVTIKSNRVVVERLFPRLRVTAVTPFVVGDRSVVFAAPGSKNAAPSGTWVVDRDGPGE